MAEATKECIGNVLFTAILTIVNRDTFSNNSQYGRSHQEMHWEGTIYRYTNNSE